MKRGELYRVYKPNSRDPKRFRGFVVISRQEVIDSNFSTVICVPIYTNCTGIETQVDVGIDEELKHESCIFCDEIVSFQKSMLTDFVSSLSDKKVARIKQSIESSDCSLMLELKASVVLRRIKFGGIKNYESKNSIGNRRRFVGESRHNRGR